MRDTVSSASSCVRLGGLGLSSNSTVGRPSFVPHMRDYGGRGTQLQFFTHVLSLSLLGRYRSSQTGQTVNLLAYAFQGANPCRPTIYCHECKHLHSAVVATRRDFEANNIDRTTLCKLYSSYASIEDIDLFLLRASQIFPSMNCGVASVLLHDRLKAGKVVYGKYKHHCHSFLLLEDETVIDITADQYGGPPIYVGALIAPWSLK